MKIHDLKTHPAPFRAVASGEKTFELRLNDRDFQVGDILRLREFDPYDGAYTGQAVERRVSFILNGGEYGLPAGHVAMAIRPTDEPAPEPAPKPVAWRFWSRTAEDWMVVTTEGMAAVAESAGYKLEALGVIPRKGHDGAA